MSKSKDAEAPKAILDYLVSQNRPYSATDVLNNLHKVYGKSTVQKSLESLALQGKIKSKTYGKQVVYVADQSVYPDVPDTELKSLDLQIGQLTAKLTESRSTNRQLEAELRTLDSAISTEDAKAELQTLTRECERLEEKLNSLKTNNNSVSPEERKEIMKNRGIYVKEWRKRKRMSTDILNAILEGYPKSKKELYEVIGIETDEEYKVKPPEI